MTFRRNLIGIEGYQDGGRPSGGGSGRAYAAVRGQMPHHRRYHPGPQLQDHFPPDTDGDTDLSCQGPAGGIFIADTARVELRAPIRMLTITAASLVDADSAAEQTSLFEDNGARPKAGAPGGNSGQAPGPIRQGRGGAGQSPQK